MAKKITTIRENTDIISVDNLKDAVAENNFVDIDQELIEQIKKQIDNVLHNYSHNEQTARKAIEEWFNKLSLKNRNFDVKSLRLKITNQPVIYIQSQYHCETREFSRAHEPYRGQIIPETVEGLWEKEPQNQFTKSDIKWKRFGNNEVTDCHNCAATGKVTCVDCNGKGVILVTCVNCKGKGEIERTGAIIGRGGKKIAGGVVLRKEQCLRCSAKGKVLITCAKCEGGGKLTCKTCSGQKELFHFDNIQGNTSIIEKDLILSTFSTVNNKWIKNSKSAFNIQYKDVIHGQNENRLKNLIPENGKLLLERYNVKILPTSRVTFQFNGKERELFIIDNIIYANDRGYTIDNKKLGRLLAISLIIIAAISFGIYQIHLRNIKEENAITLNICSEANKHLSNGNIDEAIKEIKSIPISDDFELRTKDSLNTSIRVLLDKIIAKKETGKIKEIHPIFSKNNILSEDNSNLLTELNSIAIVKHSYDMYQELREFKKNSKYGESSKANDDWREIIKTDIAMDSIINLQYINPQALNVLSIEKINSQTTIDFEKYLYQLLSFNERKGIPCSIETDLKRLETLISKLKSTDLLRLLEPTIKNLKDAQIKYKNAC